MSAKLIPIPDNVLTCLIPRRIITKAVPRLPSSLHNTHPNSPAGPLSHIATLPQIGTRQPCTDPPPGIPPALLRRSSARTRAPTTPISTPRITKSRSCQLLPPPLSNQVTRSSGTTFRAAARYLGWPIISWPENQRRHGLPNPRPGGLPPLG